MINLFLFLSSIALADNPILYGSGFKYEDKFYGPGICRVVHKDYINRDIDQVYARCQFKLTCRDLNFLSHHIEIDKKLGLKNPYNCNNY